MHKRWAAALLLFFAAAALWSVNFVRLHALMDAYSGVSVRMTGGVKESALRDVLPTEAEDGLTLAAAWSRSAVTDVTAESLGTSAAVPIVTVYGDMRRTEPLTLLCGVFPTEGDADGCLLDSETAMTLFRSVEVTDVPVAINGQTFAVRGVVKAYAPAVWIRDVTAAYTNLELDAVDLSSAMARTQTYLYRHALTADCVMVQSGLYAKIAAGLVFLPVAVFLLLCGVRLIVLARRSCTRRWASVLWYATAFALAACSALTVWKHLYVPQQFLPTRAADFTFWKTLLESWRSLWRDISLLFPLPGDIVFFREMRHCLILTAATLLLFVSAVSTAPQVAAHER